MSSPKITTLGALKKTSYNPQNIKEELASKLQSFDVDQNRKN